MSQLEFRTQPLDPAIRVAPVRHTAPEFVAAYIRYRVQLDYKASQSTHKTAENFRRSQPWVHKQLRETPGISPKTAAEVAQVLFPGGNSYARLETAAREHAMQVPLGGNGITFDNRSWIAGYLAAKGYPSSLCELVVAALPADGEREAMLSLALRKTQEVLDDTQVSNKTEIRRAR